MTSLYLDGHHKSYFFPQMINIGRYEKKDIFVCFIIIPDCDLASQAQHTFTISRRGQIYIIIFRPQLCIIPSVLRLLAPRDSMSLSDDGGHRPAISQNLTYTQKPYPPKSLSSYPIILHHIRSSWSLFSANFVFGMLKRYIYI